MLTSRDVDRPGPSFELSARPSPLRALVGDVWRSRRLVELLARRDFLVRYRRASFGLAWAVVVPLVQALVLALVLTRVARLGTPGRSYPLFILSGMVAWQFFSGGLSAAATSIVDGAAMTTRIYFPRAVLPLISVTSLLYGLVLNVVLLLVLAPVLGSFPGWRLVLLAPALALMAVLTASFGLVLSAAHVYFRDVRYLLDAAQRAWFYVTPVFYPLDRLHGLRPLVMANPATGMIELFRAATVGADPGSLVSIWWTVGWIAVLLAVAAVLHRRFDRLFVDLL